MYRAWKRSVLLVAGAVIASYLPASNAEAIAARLVAAGGSHTCAVTATGGVKCWGDNTYGQLGNGTTTVATGPTDVAGVTGVVALSAGVWHTCAVLGSGQLKCWGANWWGQLGDGTTGISATAVTVVMDGATVKAVGAGYGHTCAVTSGGGLRCWGDNSSGQLGDGTTVSHPVPAGVSTMGSNVEWVAAGWSHTCAVRSDGTAACWGANDDGQVGDGSTGGNRPAPVAVSGLVGAASVYVGEHCSCALTGVGGVKCWGDNSWGQLGDGTTTDRPTASDVSGLAGGVLAMALGSHHACVVTSTLVKCWGGNADGQLGEGTRTSRQTPVDVPGTGQVIGLTASTSWWDADHTCAVTWRGQVLCWGDNASGQVGDGGAGSPSPVAVAGLSARNVAVSVGSSSACALSWLGGVKCWGSNYYGQLGDGTRTSRATAATVTSLGSGVASISVADSHACAVMTEGGVKCWGSNRLGALGDGTTSDSPVPVAVTGLTDAKAVVAGWVHTCALTTAGAVKCWGDNFSGQLGDGTKEDRLTPVTLAITETVVSIAAGNDYTCAVTQSGAAYCWGGNAYGQLGDGTCTDRATPTLVHGLANGVVAVSAAVYLEGNYATCALTTAGTVRCWGTNSWGQLGNGTTTGSLTPVLVDGVTGATAVSVGTGHGCSLTADGARCWGTNVYGQLGNGTPAPASRTLTAVPVTVVGAPVDQIAVGGGASGGRTCAVVGEVVKCWGDDRYGRLGSGRLLVATTPFRVPGFGPLRGAEFDGDWKMDPAVYRPSTGTWFWLKSTTSNANYGYKGWGVQAQGDVPVSGDFDGDGVLDPTVFRPSVGTWFVLESHAGFTTWQHFGWGTTGDLTVAADYDGDSITDAAVYRPPNGTWYVRPSSNPTAQWSLAFGNGTDTPLPADYDGDGKADLAVYRASTGTWFFLASSTDYKTMSHVGWGVQAQGDVPAPADYDRDGKADITVFRPTTGTWFVVLSSTGGWTHAGWGQSGDTPMPADYDGDGAADLAVYRPTTGEWYIHPSSGAAQWVKVFGQSGDVPLRGGR